MMFIKYIIAFAIINDKGKQRLYTNTKEMNKYLKVNKSAKKMLSDNKINSAVHKAINIVRTLCK